MFVIYFSTYALLVIDFTFWNFVHSANAVSVLNIQNQNGKNNSYNDFDFIATNSEVLRNISGLTSPLPGSKPLETDDIMSDKLPSKETNSEDEDENVFSNISFTYKQTERPTLQGYKDDTLLPLAMTTNSFPLRNSTCHRECLALLENMTFDRIPDSYLLKKESSLTLECYVPFNENSVPKIIWLFQGTEPPTRQCSLTPQETLPLCKDFTSKDHIVDTNYTSRYIREVLILKQLQKVNAGYYICMVELSCCFNSHIMDKTLETEKPIHIYYEDYKLELGVLSSALIFLIVCIILGVIFQRRRRHSYVNIVTFKAPILEDVLHVPILADDDSFYDSDDE